MLSLLEGRVSDAAAPVIFLVMLDRKSTRLNSSHIH